MWNRCGSRTSRTGSALGPLNLFAEGEIIRVRFPEQDPVPLMARLTAIPDVEQVRLADLEDGLSPVAPDPVRGRRDHTRPFSRAGSGPAYGPADRHSRCGTGAARGPRGRAQPCGP